MFTEQELRSAVEAILSEMRGDISGKALSGGNSLPQSPSSQSPDHGSGQVLPDLLEEDIQASISVPHPHSLDALKAMKAKSPARIGVGRSGPRYRTATLLRFRADHAVAMDAVFTEVPDEWLSQHKLPKVKTQCENKDVFLTRPDLGRLFAPEEMAKIKAHCGTDTRIVVFVADGLSTAAVEANAMDCYKAIAEGLRGHNLSSSRPFFVQYGRVGAEDAIAQGLGAEVVCSLIGERPGLITAESMSAYLAYKAYPDIPEAKRTVVSNIHQKGTPAVEAGAYIADLIKTMLDKKASGLDLKL
jgi:ethanolamine ammonia-lyase small subunit